MVPFICIVVVCWMKPTLIADHIHTIRWAEVIFKYSYQYTKSTLVTQLVRASKKLSWVSGICATAGMGFQLNELISLYGIDEQLRFMAYNFHRR